MESLPGPPTPSSPPRPGEPLIRGRKFDVYRVPWLGSGERPEREVVVHPGAVLILPMLDQRTVVLIRNQRPAIGGELWELPAGTREANEPAETCAARELVEETGYRAATITRQGGFFTAPGFCTEWIEVFIATGLEPVGQQLEEAERITVWPTPWDEAIEMVRQGRIRDAKTISALLHAHCFGLPRASG